MPGRQLDLIHCNGGQPRPYAVAPITGDHIFVGRWEGTGAIGEFTWKYACTQCSTRKEYIERHTAHGSGEALRLIGAGEWNG